MPGPLGDATRRRLTDAAAARLDDDGYEVAHPETRTEPPAVATPRSGGTALAVEPLTPDDATATVIASRLAHALDREHRACFVVDDDATAETVRSLLADPSLLVAERDGHRTFHAGPDRIPVPGGGYACVRSEGLGEPTFAWRETDTPIGPVPAGPGVDAAPVDEAGSPVVPRLVCEVDGRVVAVLAGVESLREPPAEAFPYAYSRHPDDKRFRVRRGSDGEVVESASGFAPMRSAGYVPIPMPIVPEHALGAAVAPERRSEGEKGDGAEAVIDDAWDLIRVDAVDSS
ncbi:hypothetical protein [Halorubrum yunnanense]|uniref:Uncharacterized protein n=1 Tax=Halorubrum yunnanense TaxID=1526162 RepID=A0ABD5YG18_9EURY|nr:hypothetical protein [Halorubrum yunnanense]